MNVFSLMPLAALTVMLWLLWSDSVRRYRPGRIVYIGRAGLYLIMTGVLVYDLIVYRRSFTGLAFVFAIIAALVGLLGAGYFIRKFRLAG